MKRLIVLMFASLVAVYLVGCAASKPKPSEKTTKGGKTQVSSTKKKSQKNNAAEEDEVLKLLGITPEEKRAETSKKAAPAEDLSAQEKELKAKIAQLQQELNRKDSEVGELQNQLKQKEQKLKEMEEMLTTLQASGASASSQTSAQMPARRAAAPAGSFRARYEEALSLYNNRHYREAIRKFQALIQEDPNNSLSDNCQYWIGECYYSLGKYNQALVEFQKVFTFPNSNKEDDAQLKIGMTYLRLGDKARAKEAFKTLLENYPKSEYCSIAQRYLNQL
jgi:tol-pal system protein YbgF